MSRKSGGRGSRKRGRRRHGPRRPCVAGWIRVHMGYDSEVWQTATSDGPAFTVVSSLSRAEVRGSDEVLPHYHVSASVGENPDERVPPTDEELRIIRRVFRMQGAYEETDSAKKARHLWLIAR